MRSTRLLRIAIWPLAFGSALAVALALFNPEARQPSPLAKSPQHVGYQIALRPVDDASVVSTDAPISLQLSDSNVRVDVITPAEKPKDSANRLALEETGRRPATSPTHLATKQSEPSAAGKIAGNAVRASRPKQRPSRSVAAVPRAIPTGATADVDVEPPARASVRQPAMFIEASRETKKSSREPTISLGPVMEADDDTTSVRRAAPQPRLHDSSANDDASVLAQDLAGRRETSRIETQLVNLQRQIDQFIQAKSSESSQSLQRATQLIDKMEQTAQLQNLEQRLQQLQNLIPKDSPKPQPSDKAETSGKSETSAASKSEPILKAEPNAGDAERLNLTIQDAEITEVLKMMGELSGINIFVGKDVKGKVTANLQDVSVEQALVGMLRSLNCVFERDGRFIFVMTAADADARKKAGRTLVTKVYRPNYISVADLQALVTPLLTPPIGKVAVTLPAEVGIASSKDNAGGNRIAQQDALLVMDYAEVIKEVDNVLLEMDVPPLQVVIETMILSVALDDSMEFGVNFALLSGKGKDLFVSGNGRTLNNASGFPGTGGSMVPPTGQFIADTAGLKYGFLRGDMSIFVNAIEEIADTNVIAAPQLRVLNKQKAELIIGEKLSYTTTTFNQTQTIENVQFLDVGTKLILRPFIAPDGMVRMEIHPEVSSGGINPQTQLPDLETKEVTTNVMVRDGTTVVIGGLIEEKTEESQSRIPFLGAIPLVGNVFKNKSEKVKRNELIVLITPRIVSEPEDAQQGEAALFEHQERAEHFRDHLSPVNRTNLTRMEYERALDLFEQGDYLRARAHVARALRHSKNDVDAIRLRDQIDQALRENTRRLLPFASPAEPADDVPLPSETDAQEDSPTVELKPPASSLVDDFPPRPEDILKTAPTGN